MKRLLFLSALLYLINLAGSASTHQIEIVKDVEWANPNGQSLTMDIYIPQTGKTSYPVLIVYHGGGWLINNKSVMDSMSVYIASHSEYIVCNVNYRLLADQENSVLINQIIEDALGAVLWVKDNIKKYKGDPSRIAVTGDSAGGHLAAMVIYGGKRLESDGFSGSSLGFCPTYLPEGTTADELAKKGGIEIQAALLSYPATDMVQAALNNFETDKNIFWYFTKAKPRGLFGDSIHVTENLDWYKFVSPVYNIPPASERILPPQFCMVGSNDQTTPPSSIREYVDQLKESDQPVEYWEYEGKSHAFLDSWSTPVLGNDFTRDAPPALDRMIAFMDKVFKK